MLVEINPHNPDTRLIRNICEVLKKDGVIIYPTDTVYSIGCSLYSKKAIAKLAKLKNVKLRQSNFAIICSDLSDLSEYTNGIDRATYKILNRNLPGAFTFILNATTRVARFFDSNKKTIGIRIPDSRIVQEIVKELGNPLVTTSLLSDDEILEYNTDPYQINEDWENKVEMIVDGGFGKNVGSTVVDLTQNDPEILRQGLGELDY